MALRLVDSRHTSVQTVIPANFSTAEALPADPAASIEEDCQQELNSSSAAHRTLSKVEERARKGGELATWLAGRYDEVHDVDGGFDVPTCISTGDGLRIVPRHYSHFGDERDDDSPPSLEQSMTSSGTLSIHNPPTPPGQLAFDQPPAGVDRQATDSDHENLDLDD